MIILGIETSCDDTGIALVKCTGYNCQILSNIVSSQIKIHAPYGGVVPNLAARAHLKNLKPVLVEACKKADYPKIDLMAATIGPGLIPSLLVGVNFAKSLAYHWQKPIIGVNHLEGHIYANWLKDNEKKSDNHSQLFAFPLLCLVVSGGHTQLILMKNHRHYQLLGQTRDDAAGEAFDKVAKLLGLGYPGGPIIAQRALKGDVNSFELPRPMIRDKNFDFSFSGLKTAVLYKTKNSFLNQPQINESKRQKFINDMSASFQQAVIDVLIDKTVKAAQKYQVKTILLSGGVAANQELSRQMKKAIEENLPKLDFHLPQAELCTDNGAMIAAAAYYQKTMPTKNSWAKIEAQANLELNFRKL